ncbi:MAG: response regulator, partial [Lachnospiraceae bacterium]|nr:response regulator [Lachnospiraceae bacterium]
MNELVLEVAAFIICLFCLADCLKKMSETGTRFSGHLLGRIRNRRFVYLMLVVFLMLSSFSDVAAFFFESIIPVKIVWAADLFNEIFFISHTILPGLFALYIICTAGVARKMKGPYLILFFSPFFVSEALILTNPFTGLVYHVDTNCTYYRGPLIWVLYFMAAVYLVVGVAVFLINAKKISRGDRLSVLSIFLIASTGVILQGIFCIRVEFFFDSIAMLCFLLLLEDDRLRSKGGNRRKSRVSRNFLVIIAVIFITVIIMNITVIFDTGTRQTDRIGQIQINNLKGELQQSLSDAENNLLRYSMGLEKLINDSAAYFEIERYVTKEKRSFAELTKGSCINAYAASAYWTVFPDFDMPEDYHAMERVWYKGAVNSAGQVFISEPYIDADTGDLCYTFSYLLSDGCTVAAIDYKLSEIQSIVGRMGDGQDQFAMIVTDSGMVAGCSDKRLQGEQLYDVLPQYTDIFERVRASNEHQSFRTTVNGKEKIVFDSETDNGWKLILVVDYSTLYTDIIDQMIMLGTIDFVMVAVIITFYLVSVNNQERAEKTLASTEDFIAGLSGDIKIPLQEIINISESNLKENGGRGDPERALNVILESGKQLSEKLDNLFSYSNILKEEIEASERSERAKRKRLIGSSRRIRNGIVWIMISASLILFGFSLVMTFKWGSEKISSKAQKYDSDVAVWMEQQRSILGMFSNVIESDPSLLEDYDSAVKWLDGIKKKYNNMNFAYVANPYNKEHSIIMNNGWVPDKDYRVEERDWYINTERSGDGYSISEPYFDAQTGLYCITFSRSLYSAEGQFLGVFAIDCLMDELTDVLDNSYTPDSFAFMVDADGTIINHPDSSYEISKDHEVNIEDTEYAEAYHRGQVFMMREKDGRLCSCRVEKENGSGFSVVYVQSWFGIYGRVLIAAVILIILLVIFVTAVVTVINRFISWQSDANDRLSKTAEKAVAAEKAKSRFLAQMSHEIRTPINAVLGMNEMILRESDDDNIRDYAGSIRLAGRNLLGLINSILDFSKIEEGKMEIMPVKYDTASMIDNIITSVSKRASDKGLVFESHIDSSLPASLFGDDMRVSQVAVNLLTNAVKYTKEGRVDLFVDGIRISDECLELRMRVKDTGIGIREEDMEKLFESFTRLEENRNRTVEGTGLGMAIVNRLLDMMGSKLEVKSVYGEGSEFSFGVRQEILDDHPIGDYAARAREVMENEENEKHLFAPEAKLLVVDDNDMNLKVAKNLLKLNGIEPDLALSGKDALEMMKKNSYDLVLLDHMMPGMDGIETLRKAREEGIIKDGCFMTALTANAVVGARESYLEAGFDDYLSKPIEIKALENLLVKSLPEEKIAYRSRDKKTADGAEPETGPKGQEETVSDTGETDTQDMYRILEENGIDTKAAL